jgi:microcystin degradation protein MlrC
MRAKYVFVITGVFFLLVLLLARWGVGQDHRYYAHHGENADRATGQERLRILTGGIRHESNTFSTLKTSQSDFFVDRGEEALKDKEWAKALKEAGVEIIPTTHAYARPSGVVSQAAFDQFQNEILEGAKKAGKLDGIYLDMHGALHADGYADAQAHFIKALRAIVGDDVLICGSFDLHGNLSPEFIDGLNILTAYRTAPHVDEEETKVRAVRLLLDAIKRKIHPRISYEHVPILIPGEKGITSVEPLKTLYSRLPEISKKEGLMDASIFIGYAWADLPRASMSVEVVAEDESHLGLARQEVRRLAQEVWDNRHKFGFDVEVDDIDGAIKTAMAAPEKTVFITDSGDNTTGGAAGDNPLVLERLLAHKVGDAVVAGIADKEAVEACARAGVGAQVQLTIGGKLDSVFGKPLTIKGIVRNVILTGEKAAVVEVDHVLVVLLGKRRSFTSPNDFKEVGIDPLAHKIVVVKLGYLFAELRQIAPRTIMALTPGFCYQVLEKLPYKNVIRPVIPLDPQMTWRPK